MSSTKKKRKTAKTTKNPSEMLSPTSESTRIPSLPDDLLLTCLARVSTLYYPTISLVSKRFRTLLTSPEFHKTRSLLGRTESRLFLCFRSSPDRNQGSWFSLCRKPNRQTLTNGYVLAPIPVPKSPQALHRGQVVVGSNIYVIGGELHTPSSSVSILDCRSYTWREAPSMRMERLYPTINVCDGKIYVSGGCKNYDSWNWMEVFDPKTQTWEFVSLTPLAAQRCGKELHRSATIKGEIVMFRYKGVAYKPKEDRWEAIEEDEMDLGCKPRLWSCVIDNVIFCLYKLVRAIKWYDSKRRCWMDVKGLDSLTKIEDYGFKRLVNYDGKMLVLWDKYPPCCDEDIEIVIWCGVISLERRNEDEIWGNIEWFDSVLTLPESHECVFAVTTNV